jgi:hypothetical protein
VGLGDTTGLYHGTQQINQGQMDRWNIVCHAQLPAACRRRDRHRAWRKCRAGRHGARGKRQTVQAMVAVADLTRAGFIAGDMSTVMSPRTVITWAENARDLQAMSALAFRLTFLNKCDEAGAAAGGRVLPALLRRGTADRQLAAKGGLIHSMSPRFLLHHAPRSRSASSLWLLEEAGWPMPCTVMTWKRGRTSSPTS